MKETIIIKTENSKRVRSILDKEKINYEVFPKRDQELAEDDKLLQEYREAWKNPQRLAEAKQWEQAAVNDWVKRVKKGKK